MSETLGCKPLREHRRDLARMKEVKCRWPFELGSASRMLRRDALNIWKQQSEAAVSELSHLV